MNVKSFHLSQLISITCEQNLDKGQSSFISPASAPDTMVPTPAVGYWRKEGYLNFFVEVESRPNGTKEIEVELKWSDKKPPVSRDGHARVSDLNSTI